MSNQVWRIPDISPQNVFEARYGSQKVMSICVQSAQSKNKNERRFCHKNSIHWTVQPERDKGIYHLLPSEKKSRSRVDSGPTASQNRAYKSVRKVSLGRCRSDGEYGRQKRGKFEQHLCGNTPQPNVAIFLLLRNLLLCPLTTLGNEGNGNPE